MKFYKKSIFRKYLAFFCSLILVFNMLMPAYADTGVISKVNEENFSMTANTVTIDGVELTKEEIKESLKTVRFIQNGSTKPKSPVLYSAILEYEKLSFNPQSKSAIVSLGLGVSAIFGKISYTFKLAGHDNEWWKCSVDGYRLNIYCSAEGMIINGYSVSYSWLTDILINAVDSKAKSGDSENEGEKTKEEEQAEALEDVLKDAKPGKKTKGPSKQWEKEGGYEDALKDYNKLNPSDSKETHDEKGVKRIGKLANGDTVIARSYSDEGSPTLEIQKLGVRKKIKIRYK